MCFFACPSLRLDFVLAFTAAEVVPWTVLPAVTTFLTRVFARGEGNVRTAFLDAFASNHTPLSDTSAILVYRETVGGKSRTTAIQLRLSVPIHHLWGLPHAICGKCAKKSERRLLMGKVTGDHAYGRLVCSEKHDYGWFSRPSFLSPSGRDKSVFLNTFPLTEQEASFLQTHVDDVDSGKVQAQVGEEHPRHHQGGRKRSRK